MNSKLPENFCLSPFINLTIEPSGHIRLCCATKHSLGKIQEIKSIKDVWYNGDEIQKIRTSFKRGDIPECCSISCFAKEKKGLRSRRMKIESWFPGITQIPETLEIYDMDISLSNSCNLQCVMCSSEYSSSWFKDDERLLRISPYREQHVKRKYLIPSYMTMSQMDEVISMAKTAQKITFKGGEPTYDKRLLYFLDECLKNNICCPVELITNLSIISEAVLQRLDHFNKVTISASIDAIGELQKWMRGVGVLSTDDAEVVIGDLLNRGFTVCLNVTVTPYNLWNIRDYILWTRKNEKVHVNFSQISTYPRYCSPGLIPLEMRRKVAEDLEDMDLTNISHVQRIISYLKMENPDNWQTSSIAKFTEYFLAFTEEMNRIRGVKIQDIVPEIQIVIDQLKNG